MLNLVNEIFFRLTETIISRRRRELRVVAIARVVSMSIAVGIRLQLGWFDFRVVNSFSHVMESPQNLCARSFSHASFGTWWYVLLQYHKAQLIYVNISMTRKVDVLLVDSTAVTTISCRRKA